jgi:hypothetical protein
MPDCIICYEDGAPKFVPEIRHTACVCKYDIHNSCYKKWLRSSQGLAFHCVICRNKLTESEATEIRNKPDLERNLRYSLAIFFIVINFYKQLIALLIIVSIAIYVKRVIEIQAERRRNYHYC